MPSERVIQSVRDILGAVGLIQKWINDAGGIDHALQDSLVCSAVERQLLIISEASIRIDHADAGYAPANAPEIDWPGVRGIGNFIRHRYHDVHLRMLDEILRHDIEPLKAACLRLLGQAKA
jgi:uncharacterized protein with HEPN domain